MAIYAIGDIQGCFDELQRLLQKLEFDADTDTLWFAGDLVNRGPKSLEVVRFVQSLGDSAISVQGNHDLHLQAVALGDDTYRKKDTFDDILNADDRDELLHWLRHRPVLHYDATIDWSMLHAGLPPQWDFEQAQSHARELETVLRSDDYIEYFDNMYGNGPDRWHDDLNGWNRLRFITNCFTRLRYCSTDGTLALEEKGSPGTQQKHCLPWFEIPDRRSANKRIVFGHWSTLGHIRSNNVISLDTGCLWGGILTAVQLDHPDQPATQVGCEGHRSPKSTFANNNSE